MIKAQGIRCKLYMRRRRLEEQKAKYGVSHRIIPFVYLSGGLVDYFRVRKPNWLFDLADVSRAWRLIGLAPYCSVHDPRGCSMSKRKQDGTSRDRVQCRSNVLGAYQP